MKAYYRQIDRKLKSTPTFDLWQDSTLTSVFTEMGAYRIERKKHKIKVTVKKFKKIVEGIAEYIPEDIYKKIKEDYEDSLLYNRRYVYYAIR